MWRLGCRECLHSLCHFDDGADIFIKGMRSVSTKLKIVLMCGVGVLILLSYVGIGTHFIQNGVTWQNIISVIIAVFVTVWWVRDLRTIIRKSKASKED